MMLYGAIMYFYNVFFIIFQLPKSKIYLSIHPFCLTLALRGLRVAPVWQARGSGHPCSVNPPTPPTPFAAGWQEESVPSWVLISCLFFYEVTQLCGLAPFLRLISSVSPLYSFSEMSSVEA